MTQKRRHINNEKCDKNESKKTRVESATNNMSPSLFTPRQYADFSTRLAEETQLADKWARQGRYVSTRPPRMGCELECCLINDSFLPAPEAADFIKTYADDSATFELGRFNVEFNIPPMVLRGAAFAVMQKNMEDILRRAAQAAQKNGNHIFMCGMLPTLTPADFVAAMVTDMPRYQMLERELKVMKQGHPFAVNLGYGDGVQFAVNSAAIEAAATSFQAHLEIAENNSATFFNAAQAAMAPVLAAGANAPFFMGRKLWAETRVPLFEQILYERFTAGQRAKKRRRDDIFGLHYLRRSVVELFMQNHDYFPPLLPLCEDSPPSKMRHLMLHNGTIWRWNRPIMGFAEDGSPQLRIEHRPLPSGPTVADMCANLAFFIGLVYAWHKNYAAAEWLPFAVIRDNFYAAARDGLECEITWTNGKKAPIRELLLKEIIPAAADGLSRLSDLDENDCARVLEIIRARAQNNQNGAQWQRRYVEKHGGGTAGMARLTAAYWQNQQSARPVHEWKV